MITSEPSGVEAGAQVTTTGLNIDSVAIVQLIPALVVCTVVAIRALVDLLLGVAPAVLGVRIHACTVLAVTRCLATLGNGRFGIGWALVCVG